MNYFSIDLAVVLGVWKDLPSKEKTKWTILQGEGLREMQSDESPLGPTLLKPIKVVGGWEQKKRIVKNVERSRGYYEKFVEERENNHVTGYGHRKSACNVVSRFYSQFSIPKQEDTPEDFQSSGLSIL